MFKFLDFGRPAHISRRDWMRIGSIGDITIFRQASSGGGSGSFPFNVAVSATAINPGEPVMLIAGATSIIPNASSNLLTIPSPFVPYSITGTGLLGIAQITSTNTASAVGSVDVVPATSGTTWLINANSGFLVNTQAKYDALVGHRVLIDLTAGVYTLLTTDSALNGCLIMPLNVFKFPGKIAFKFLDGVSALI